MMIEEHMEAPISPCVSQLGFVYLYLHPIILTDVTYIMAWINNHIHFTVWDLITGPCLTFNGNLAVEGLL